MSSTVADLLKIMRFRVDYNTDLYPFINQAIRLIAKRLYWFDSGLLKTPLLVEVAGNATYSADTISFDASTRTIGDTANGIVTAGLLAGCYFTTDSTLNPGPFHSKTVVAGGITVYGDEDLVDEAAGSTITLTMAIPYTDLPTDFWGLCEGKEDDLVVRSTRRKLTALRDRTTAKLYEAPGMSVSYEVLQRRLYLYPPSESPITVEGRYFAEPTKLTALTDTIPFYSMFDDAIIEFTIAAYKGEALKVLQGMIYDAVDVVIAKYDKSRPDDMEEAVKWDQMM